jgi:putative ABC transport system permease protein
VTPDRTRFADLRGAFHAHVVFAVRTALEAVAHNRLRAGLTSLGILFGVASVIAMLAIGKGAESEILEQMKLLGSNNVLIRPYVEQREGNAEEEDARQVKRWSPGLTYLDAEAIARGVPGLDAVSSEIVVNSSITREGRRRSGRIVGVDSTYFRMLNMPIERGAMFTPEQMEQGRPVAVIGHGVRTRFFTTEDPIGKPLKVGETWLTVVGVLTDRQVAGENAERSASATWAWMCSCLSTRCCSASATARRSRSATSRRPRARRGRRGSSSWASRRRSPPRRSSRSAPT